MDLRWIADLYLYGTLRTPLDADGAGEFVQKLLNGVGTHWFHSRCSASGPRNVMFGKNS